MSKPHAVALAWLRRDLRLADNPALAHALEYAERVIPVFIHAPDEEAPWAPGAASQWWLHNSLAQLSEALQAKGSALVLRRGPSLTALQNLIAEAGATLVCWNRVYEPACIARDTHIKSTLQQSGVEASSHNAALLFEPWQLRTQSQGPYRVFTPFWRVCQQQLHTLPLPLAAPKRMPAPSVWPASEALDALQLLPSINWYHGMAEHWQPGEAGAQRRLKRFWKDSVAAYAGQRDRPDLAGTSALSPHLHFGEIGPRQILAQLNASDTSAGGDSYVRELGWREFNHHLLYHFPHTTDAPMNTRFSEFRWQSNAAALHAWQRGLTGIPLVDAGMRELWHTGWMHNRIRMVVASFLTKNLRIDWRDGARWFWDTLVDADLANNTSGWQWTAGCGADAAPYFRVFNPVLQTERHDPQRVYLRRWLPELARLPDAYIHQPWNAPAKVLEQAKMQLGRDYPLPIVDLAHSRAEALEAYAQIRQ